MTELGDILEHANLSFRNLQDAFGDAIEEDVETPQVREALTQARMAFMRDLHNLLDLNHENDAYLTIQPGEGES